MIDNRLNSVSFYLYTKNYLAKDGKQDVKIVSVEYREAILEGENSSRNAEIATIDVLNEKLTNCDTLLPLSY